jgi:hypothetical protein
MFQYLIAAILSALTLAYLATAQRPTIEQIDAYRKELRPLLDAIRQVESGGNDEATGDGGNAIGAYQIWIAYWSDAVEWVPDLKGEYEGCRARWYAERIMIAYWHRYARRALIDGDYEKLARVHNGGPKGHLKQATEKYWDKVVRLLED